MLTLFAIPKAFEGHIGVIQRNALESWARLGPWCRVVLMGQEAGVETAAKDAGADWRGDLATNEFGTPLLSDAFAQAAQMTQSPWLCYVNSDILLTRRFHDALKAIQGHKALLITERHNVDVTAPLDFHDPHWQEKIEALARDQSGPINPSAIDLFAFPRQSPLTKLPPLPWVGLIGTTG